MHKTEPDCSDMVAVRQLIFDSHGDIRTPDGNMGQQTRVTVMLPFRSEAFQALRNTDISDSGNVNTYLTSQQLTGRGGRVEATRPPQKLLCRLKG